MYDIANAEAEQAPIPAGTAVHVAFEDGIAWVTLNRPDKRNAMSPTLNREMNEILELLEVDDRCGVVVLTGAGESFSAGIRRSYWPVIPACRGRDSL